MPDLDYERITLNAIPEGEMPVFHASQFETMRPFMADLKWGSEDFAPGDSCWCTLSIRKTDDTLVIIDDIEVVTNTVSCILTQQAVACIGDNFCQLKVWATSEDNEDGCIACLNFILHVQPDPEADGITSESEINNLTEQIEEITQQVIGDDYYTKVQTDALLDLKADKSTTYTKSEVDTALNLKADKSTTYTKSQVDSALALKADASDVYTKAQTYNKTETDTLLAAKADSADLATVATTGDYDDLINKPTIPAQIQSDYAQADNTKVDYIKNKPDIDAMIAAALLAVMPVDSAGPSAIANFNTELAVDLVDCKTTLDPSLDGYSAVNLTACGVNLWDEQWLNGYYNPSNGEFVSNANYICSKNLIRVSSSTQYYVHSDNNILIEVLEYRIDGTYIRRLSSGSKNEIITTDNECAYIHIGTHNSGDITTYTSGVSINYPATDTHYHAFTGNAYAIALGDTYYGGTLDVTRGKLTVTWARDTINDLPLSTGSFGGVDYFIYDQHLKKIGNFNIISDYFDTATQVGVTNMPDNSILAGGSNTYIYIRCDTYSTVADLKANLGNYHIGYELATPIEIDLGSGTAVTASAGVNNVYSDTGDTTVQFKDSIQHYIDTRS